MPPIAGLQYLLEYYVLVLFVKTKFSIRIQDSKPARIWTQTLTIELHSIDFIHNYYEAGSALL